MILRLIISAYLQIDISLMINVETGFVWCLSFSTKLFASNLNFSDTIFSTAFSFQLFQLVLANFSVGYVPLLLLTEYKLLRHPFSLPRKTWLMKSHSSHLRHALYKKQGQREILSSWLIKCVFGQNVVNSWHQKRMHTCYFARVCVCSLVSVGNDC